MKSLKVKIYLTPLQKKKIDYDLQVSNYVYNKTVNIINKNISFTKLSKFDLRDKLVTFNSRKSNTLLNKVNKFKSKIESIINEYKKQKKLKYYIKAYMIKLKIWDPVKCVYDSLRKETPPTQNKELKEFELETHKDIRTKSVFEAYTNFKTCKDKVRKGDIKFFRLKYRSKKKNGLCMTLPSSMIKIKNGVISLTSKDLKDKTIKVHKRNLPKLKKIKTLKDCRLTKKFGEYYLHIPIELEQFKKPVTKRVIGIDPGVSTFLSCYTPEKTVIIQQNRYNINQLDYLKSKIKELRKKKLRERIRRKLLSKIDRKKENRINEIHWKSINYLVKNYDSIFLEKFESQGFVKNGKNKNLNRVTNNLKPYTFRQRLIYKATCFNKQVVIVNARYTSKTCSSCGNLKKKISLSERVYHCNNCKQSFNRDINAAKNILMRGLLN